MKQIKEKNAYFDIATAADKWAWGFPGGAEILEINVTPLGTDAGGGTIVFDSLVGTTRGAADVGTITIPASNVQGQTLQEIPSNGLVRIAAGGALIVEVSAEDVTNLLVAVSVKFRDLGEYNANSDNIDAA